MRPRDLAPVVVLAEDDDELRHLVARRLRGHGCEIVEARTGLELAELLLEHAAEHRTRRTVELVISDILMPGLTGLELVALLRRIDWALPVILMTGFGDADTHAEAARLGAAVFDKPVDLDVLAAAVVGSLALGAPA